MKIRKKTESEIISNIQGNIQLIEEEVRKSNVKISSNLLTAFSEFENGKTGEQISKESPAVYKEYLKVLHEITERQTTEAKEVLQQGKNILIVHRRAAPYLEESVENRLHQLASKLFGKDEISKDQETDLIKKFNKNFNALYADTELTDAEGDIFPYQGVNVEKQEIYFKGEDKLGKMQLLTMKMRNKHIQAQKGIGEIKEKIEIPSFSQEIVKEMFSYMSAPRKEIKEPAEQYSLEL